MTYREKYNEIIEFRQKNPISKADCYCESHHILPKSCGGTNDPENLVLLTGAEHFKAHYYLAKAMKEEKDPNYKKMIFALTKMKYQIVKNSDLTDSQLEELGKIYEEARSEWKEAMGQTLKGRKFTEESRKRMSEAQKGNKNTLGYHHSEETKRKISKASTGRHHSAKTKEKMRENNRGENNPMYGRHFSEETKEKMRLKKVGYLVGTHWWNNGTICRQARECPGEGWVKGRLKKKTA